MNPDSFICPYPLVSAPGNKTYPDKYTTHWAYKEGNCAVRCPTIVLTENEFSEFNDTVFHIAIVSFVMSLVVLLFHMQEAKRYYVRILFILGFACSSVIFIFFYPLNKDYDIICSDDRAHYIEKDPLCVFQAFLIIYCFLWVAIWGAVYSMDIYLVTSFSLTRREIENLRKYYLGFVALTAGVLSCIGLFSGNLGYDYTTSLPNCLFLYAEEDLFFWLTLVLPYSVCVSICTVASVRTAYRLHKVFVYSRRVRRTGHVASNSSSPILTSIINCVRISLWITKRSETSGDNSATAARKNTVDSTRDDSIDGIGREWSLDIDSTVTHIPHLADIVVSPLPRLRPTAVPDPDGGLSIYSENSEGPIPNTSEDGMELSPSNSSTKTSVIPDDNDMEEADSSSKVKFSQSSESSRRIELSPRTASNTTSGTATVSCTDDRSPAGVSMVGILANTFSDTWKYNGRVLIFLAVYCLLSWYVIPTFIYLFQTSYDDHVDSANDYVECLITASFLSPLQTQTAVDSFAKEMCGKYPTPRPPIKLLVSIVYWAAAFGIIPALIFGSIVVNKFQEWMNALLRRAQPRNM
mmetsp:Transcript_5076/g.7753  ORF Transcript_5076/g.7753 Transcript_5076/m.7753 type:complete len:578 (-) Transcript_5076:29-1762(-)